MQFNRKSASGGEARKGTAHILPAAAQAGQSTDSKRLEDPPEDLDPEAPLRSGVMGVVSLRDFVPPLAGLAVGFLA